MQKNNNQTIREREGVGGREYLEQNGSSYIIGGFMQSRCKLFLSIASQMTTKSLVYSTSIHHVEPYTEGFSIPGPSTYTTVEALKENWLSFCSLKTRS